MFFWVVLALFFSWNAHAFDPCQYFKVIDCNRVSMSSGAALPSLSAAHNMNPGSIPSRPTPIGLEVIGSNVDTTDTSDKFNYSIVKGFQRMGAAVSTNAEDTFFNYSYAQSFEGTPFEGLIDRDTSTGIIPSLNLGTAVPIPVGSLNKILNPSVGLVAHYDKTTGKWGLGSGLNLTTGFVTAGFSFLQESTTEGYQLMLHSLMLGVHLGILQFEYARLKYSDTLFVTRPAHITTVSLRFRKVILTAAMRTFKNIEDEEQKAYLGGIQFLLSKNIATGYMYNYRRACHSLGVQVFL